MNPLNIFLCVIAGLLAIAFAHVLIAVITGIGYALLWIAVWFLTLFF